MKGIKENDLKRIFGEVMFNEFITYMKGKTYIKIDNQPTYYETDINGFLLVFFRRTYSELIYWNELRKVEIEV
jgi:hypothetical protein